MAPLFSLISREGIMVDGDWVESKDQDPNGEVRLIQLADVGNGKFIDKSNRWLTSEKAAKLNCTTLKTGDLLISRLGEPLGKACIFPLVESECVTVVDVHIFRSGTPLVSHRWLMHALNSHSVRTKVESQSSGTTRKRITGQKLKDLDLPIPPVSEQQRIASRVDELFSSIDDGERALERVQKLVERYRQSVLKAAVTGELTREWRERHAGQLESGEALLTRILEARRQVWETAELAKMTAKKQPSSNDLWKMKYKEPMHPKLEALKDALPAGWTLASTSQLQSAEPHALAIGPFGSDLKVSNYRSEGVPLVFVRNIRTCNFRSDLTKFITKEKARDLGAHVVRFGDILITKMGDPPGDACIYPDMEDAVITADCIKWRLDPILSNRAYFANFINSWAGRSQIKASTKGVAQQKVTLNAFKNIAVALPSLTEQDEIANRVRLEEERLGKVLETILLEARRLLAMKRSILNAAFSGELVPQDVTDEPASVLLERIAAERVATPKRPAPKQARRKKAKA